MLIRNLSAGRLKNEADNGGRFVTFTYVISLLIVSYKRSSEPYLIRPGEKAFIKGIKYTIISALFGWWGIPNGPRYTLNSLKKNSKGGIDVTDQVVDTATGFLLFEEAEANKPSQPMLKRAAS